jgi:tetratricopeptide (TPR) repeat protein
MAALRYLTLVWPGLPWLWLRGSRLGLVLALAFAVTVDVAVLTTFIWPELTGLGFSIGLWTATAAVWLVSTASAVSTFPPPIPRVRAEAADGLFTQARDAYLARDWLAAEAHLEALLALAPTDGEAQLLWATLLRRVGRTAEAREALAKLSRSDSGGRWRAAIDREIALLDSGGGPDAAAEGPTILRVEPDPVTSVPHGGSRGAAA